MRNRAYADAHSKLIGSDPRHLFSQEHLRRRTHGSTESFCVPCTNDFPSASTPCGPDWPNYSWTAPASLHFHPEQAHPNGLLDIASAAASPIFLTLVRSTALSSP